MSKNTPDIHNIVRGYYLCGVTLLVSAIIYALVVVGRREITVMGENIIIRPFFSYKSCAETPVYNLH